MIHSLNHGRISTRADLLDHFKEISEDRLIRRYAWQRGQNGRTLSLPEGGYSSMFHTARYLLRDFDPKDRAAFVRYQTDPVFQRFYPENERGLDAANALFDRFLLWRDEQPRRNFQLAVVETDCLELVIGSCGLRQHGCPAGEAEIGIELASSHWRQQAASEIMTALVAWGASPLGLRQLRAETAPGNHAAIRLLERTGFVREDAGRTLIWRLTLQA